MNTNRLLRSLARVPEIRTAVREHPDVAVELDRLFARECHTVLAVVGNVKMKDTVLGYMGRMLMLLDKASDANLFIMAFTAFVRSANFRTCACISNRKVTSLKSLTQACEIMHYTDDDMYAVADAISRLKELPDGIIYSDALESLVNGPRISMHDRIQQIEALERPVQEPEPPQSAEEAVRQAIGEVRELPNKQRLVEVKLGTRVHYIVVDEGVDIMRAPRIYDMVCRERLHLSINITTDRLERCWRIEQLLNDGMKPAEIAKELGVNLGIVKSDIRCLRAMGRIPQSRRRASL